MFLKIVIFQVSPNGRPLAQAGT